MLTITPVRIYNSNNSLVISNNHSKNSFKGNAGCTAGCLLSTALLTGLPAVGYLGVDLLARIDAKQELEKTLGYKKNGPQKEKEFLTKKTMTKEEFLERLGNIIDDKFEEPIAIEEMSDMQREIFNKLTEAEKQEVLDAEGYLQAVLNNVDDKDEFLPGAKQDAYKAVSLLQELLKSQSSIARGGEIDLTYEDAIRKVIEKNENLNLDAILKILQNTRDKIANGLSQEDRSKLEEKCDQKIENYNQIVKEYARNPLTIASKVIGVVLGLLIGIMSGYTVLGKAVMDESGSAPKSGSESH